MSHREREHAPGAAERGNDWLDGALAGWLLFIAINGGNLAWHSLRDGAAWSTSALNLAVPVLAVAAIFPLLRFHRVGWGLAFLALGLMATREGMMLAAAQGAWRATVAFLAVDLLGMGYLLWIIPEFWPRHPDAEPVASARPIAPSVAAEAPSAPTPVTQALAAIHHRIVAAGSACSVTEVAVRAEAGRFGVTPAALRTEGLSLYRTFLRHFMADGALSADEERELICLERALDLDDDGVWRLRAEAGLVGGMAASAPSLLTASDASLPAPRPALAAPADADQPVSVDADQPMAVDADRSHSADVPITVDADQPMPVDADRVTRVDVDPQTAVIVDQALPVRAAEDDRPADVADSQSPIAVTEPLIDEVPMPVSGTAVPIDGPVPMGAVAAEPDPSAQADITSSVPRFQSPGLDARAAAADSPMHEPPVSEQPESAESAAPIEPAASTESASADAPEALADYEEHELGVSLAWAGIGALPAGASRRGALERLRALYRAATEPLSPCETDVALDADESCLAQREVQVYVAPAGAAPPPPDLPGPVLPRRALVDGTLDHARDLSDLQRRAVCRFVLTERRLLLVTSAGQRSELAVSRVRAVLPYRNGIEVRQQRGAPVFLAFTDGVDDAAMRIDRAASDLRARA
ncbi:hypothetical protein [Longimicrobium sp.]|uniref:hypothetical protein n=1 Tax=Longimicrobium sp. TaxID=2029185 RepID=UPI002E36CD93|nr:hypothetical protein [Longimicrobium sp.]HEX6040169.1 hypothetical protein [Longimicrobium sp.]